MSNPRSSMIVFSPRSVNSFAAQPPLMPEPTTIASNVLSAINVCLFLLLFKSPHSGDYDTGDTYSRFFEKQQSHNAIIRRRSLPPSLARRSWHHCPFDRGQTPGPHNP